MKNLMLIFMLVFVSGSTYAADTIVTLSQEDCRSDAGYIVYKMPSTSESGEVSPGLASRIKSIKSLDNYPIMIQSYELTDETDYTVKVDVFRSTLEKENFENFVISHRDGVNAGIDLSSCKWVKDGDPVGPSVRVLDGTYSAPYKMKLECNPTRDGKSLSYFNCLPSSGNFKLGNPKTDPVIEYVEEDLRTSYGY